MSQPPLERVKQSRTPSPVGHAQRTENRFCQRRSDHGLYSCIDKRSLLPRHTSLNKPSQWLPRKCYCREQVLGVRVGRADEWAEIPGDETIGRDEHAEDETPRDRSDLYARSGTTTYGPGTACDSHTTTFDPIRYTKVTAMPLSRFYPEEIQTTNHAYKSTMHTMPRPLSSLLRRRLARSLLRSPLTESR